MPNFKLSSGIVGQIHKRCQALTERRVDYARSGFPLSADDLQAATMPNDLLADLRSLAERGIQELPREQNPDVRLTRDKCRGLQRTAVLSVHLPEPIYVARTTRFYGSDVFETRHMHTLAIDPDAIGPDAAARLVAWANNLVRVSRHKALVDDTVFTVLAACTSVGHVMAAWPLLATLVHDPFWKARFRNPPRDLRNYAPKIELLRRMGKQMQASEAVLAEAEMLEPFTHKGGSLVAYLHAWEKLPGDLY